MGENGVDNVDEYKERENEENAEHVNMFEDSRNNITGYKAATYGHIIQNSKI